MNKLTIFIVAALLLLSGCAKEECRIVSATINTQAANLEVHPETVRVRQGCTIDLRIVPPREILGDVTIKHEKFPEGGPADDEERWLDKKNTDSKDHILIKVPLVATKGLHKYSVAIPGFDTLDPNADVDPAN